MRLSIAPLDLSAGKRYPLDGSEIPFPTLDTLEALLPGYGQGDDAGAMRDIVLEVVRRLQNKIWADTGSQQNPFVSPRYSVGGMLDIWGIVRQKPRLVSEVDGACRTRLLADDTGITPNAIKAAVLAQAAAFFNAKVVFQEPASDCDFFAPNEPTSAVWCSFYQPASGLGLYWNYDPTVTNQTTGGYYAPQKQGGQFWVLMQLGAGSDALSPRFTTVSGSTAEDPQDFYANNSVDWGFFSTDGETLELRIAAEVEALKAFGVSWLLIEDPNLNGAI